MYDMLIRKKALKIQERLGMRIGIMYGTTKRPIVKNPAETLDVLKDLYKIGLRAFVLPKEMFAKIHSTSDLYKQHYADLIKIKETAQKLGIELALHHDKLTDNPDETLRTFANIASIMDARAFIIHPTFYANMPQDQALKLVVYKINEIVVNLRAQARIGVETTGKMNQLGTVEEVIDIAKRTQSTEPVLNWAHIHARGTGALRSQSDFRAILDMVRRSIGQSWLGNAYFLFSGISYGPSGEIKHIPLANADINLEYLIREVMSLNIKGTLIFEDPDRDRFVLKMLDKLADMVR